MTAQIQVLSIHRTAGTSSLRAFVDLQVGAVKIGGCKIVQQDGQRAWVAMPSIKTDSAWNNVVEITSKDLKARIADAVLSAWETHQLLPEVIPPARQAERGRATAQALDQRADNWTRRQPLPPSGDPGQRNTGNPDAPFDDALPW